MKKKTGTYNGIYGRKWRLIWTVLILIFLLISVSGAGNSTESQASDGMSPESKIDDGNSTNSMGSAGEELEPDIGVSNETGSEGESPEPDIGVSNETGSEGESPEPKIEASNGTGSPETAEEELDSGTGASNSTDSRENVGTGQESNTGVSNETHNKESGDGNPELKIGLGNETENEESEKENPDQKAGENNSTESHENFGNKLEPGTGTEKRIESSGSEDANPEQKTGEEESSENIEGEVEEKTRINNDTDNQESIEDDRETGTYDETDSRGYVVEIPEQKQEASDEDSPENDGANLKLRVKTGDGTDIQKSVGTKTESKTEVCNGTKSLKSMGVETEPKTKTCNGTKSLESKGVKPEIKVCNWTYSAGNEEVMPEIKQEESSWNNLKFIISYPYSLRSFYTVNESVKISYKGPEAFGQQNVDVYLVKERSLNIPEEAVSNGMNEGTISLEDIFNNNTESYIEIPAALNDGGDLSPLTLGPLPAGSYWILITLAGNETETSGPEKEILLANYFEVLEYEMGADAPYALEEGENFEVNLNLKNAPAQKSYTYWAVLIREDAYTVYRGTGPSWMTAGTRPLVNGVDIIKNLETNLTKYESRAGKDELKSEIQTLVGEGNGTVSIGEENQSTLSLTSLELPPGDYLLLAGAYENDDGLAGIAQKELRISAESSYGLGLKSSSGNHTFGNISSMKNKVSSFMGINSILETPKAFIFEDIKPYIQAKAIVEVVRNPPKVPSFLLGFAGTLLIVLAILRRIKR